MNRSKAAHGAAPGRWASLMSRHGGRLTGIELLAIRQQSAEIVNMDLVSLLRLSLALDGKSDIDLELLGDGEGREERKR